MVKQVVSIKATSIKSLEMKVNEQLKTLKDANLINFIKSKANIYHALIQYEAD